MAKIDAEALLRRSIAEMDGRPCHSCDAEARFESVDEGIVHLTILHDDDCPVLAEYQSR
jgi:hypothetical protein